EAVEFMTWTWESPIGVAPSDTVRRVTGGRGRTFSQWAAAYAEEFRGAAPFSGAREGRPRRAREQGRCGGRPRKHRSGPPGTAARLGDSWGVRPRVRPGS